MIWRVHWSYLDDLTCTIFWNLSTLNAAILLADVTIQPYQLHGWINWKNDNQTQLRFRSNHRIFYPPVGQTVSILVWAVFSEFVMFHYINGHSSQCCDWFVSISKLRSSAAIAFLWCVDTALCWNKKSICMICNCFFGVYTWLNCKPICNEYIKKVKNQIKNLKLLEMLCYKMNFQ